MVSRKVSSLYSTIWFLFLKIFLLFNFVIISMYCIAIFQYTFFKFMFNANITTIKLFIKLLPLSLTETECNIFNVRGLRNINNTFLCY